MTDELDQMSEGEIDRLVAVEVAGWEHHPASPGGVSTAEWRHKFGYVRKIPRYSTSADAVLPLVEKHAWRLIEDCPVGWLVTLAKSESLNIDDYVTASAPTLARAFCLALIRASRQRKRPVVSRPCSRMGREVDLSRLLPASGARPWPTGVGPRRLSLRLRTHLAPFAAHCAGSGADVGISHAVTGLGLALLNASNSAWNRFGTRIVSRLSASVNITGRRPSFT